MSILQGGVSGTLVYMETQTAVTNANGLITLQIGGGNVQQGVFSDIDWASGPYFLKTETDPDGGSNYSITSTQQLLSVPYALYAKDAGNGFSGDYNDLTNTPAIPTVPTNVSAFTNDAGYLTDYTETDPQYNAWDKDYNDLINKPTIPTVPTNVSAFTNDAGYFTDYTEIDPQFNAWDKDYNDLINKPTIPTIPTNVSAFSNDANYVTTNQLNAANYITAAQIPAQVNADWNATTGAAQILNKPSLFSGNYNDLSNKPTLFDGNYNSLSNRPNLAAVATSGNYNDLINKPSIPTAVGELANNVGYITLSQVPAQVPADWNATSGAAQILNKPTLFSGNYNDLTNKPTIPTVPANVSAFDNDAGYITSQDIPAIPTVPTNVSAFTNDAGYLTGYTEIDPQFNAWDKDYNDLTNKPTIPTVPSNVSAFTNDAGYLTSYTETDPNVPAWAKEATKPVYDYTEITNTPEIPTVPTNVSAFTNDAGYITMDSVPAIPTAISTFTNDAGYLTSFTETDPNVPAWAKESTKPVYDYTEITNTPEIPTVPTNVSAFTNDAGYITMDSVPAIPTAVSAFTNDAGYLTSYTETDPNVPAWAKEATKPAYDYSEIANTPEIPVVPTNVSAFSNDAGYITTQEIPEIPTVPTNVSAFTNDAGYLTSFTEQQVLSISNDTLFLTGGSFVKLPAGFDGDYNSLTNTPIIPTVPTVVSAFTNDAGYLTSYTETDPNVPAWAKEATKPAYDYTEITNTPEIPTVPTNVSAFTNDVGYITAQDIPEIPTVPTNVSAFTNDAGYMVEETQALSDVTAIGNSAGSRQLKDVSDPTESYDAVNLRTLTMMMDSLRTEFQQMLQQEHDQMQHQIDSLKDVINSFHPDTDNFVCGTSTVTDHEGNVYHTVQIGNQCWTKENLRTTSSPSTGTYLIPTADTGYTSTGKQARWYNNDSTTYAPMNYGLLYNWNAAVDTFNTAYGETSVNNSHYDAVSVNFTGHRRGICPKGWHVPCDAEWAQLIDYMGGQSQYVCGIDNTNFAIALASETGWSYGTSCCPGDQYINTYNASGFSAVPAGEWGLSSFIGMGSSATFWSSSNDYAHDMASIYGLSHFRKSLTHGYTYKYPEISVRCIRDEGNISITLPTVITGSVSDISETTAACGNEVAADGGATVTERGVCWRTSQNPTVIDNHTSDGTGTGSFTSSLTGLTAGTTYYVRAYATNSVGTAYGETATFTTTNSDPNPIVDEKSCPNTPTVTDHEGNVYATVQIGNQCWMRDNLRTTTSPTTGTYLIPADSTDYNTYTGKQARWYDNDSTTYAPINYGLLYNWNAAVDTFNTAYGETSVNYSSSSVTMSVDFTNHRRGICPAGWHLPSDAEWNTMEQIVSGSDWQTNYETINNNRGNHAGKLAGGNNWVSKSISGAPGDYSNTERNVSGFSAVPAGSGLSGAGIWTGFWSSSNYVYLAFVRSLSYDKSSVYRGTSNKADYHSVRCLRD